MSTLAAIPITLDDLAKVSEKAELIAGRIVPLMPTGRIPNRVAGRIYRYLDDHANRENRGEAFTDNMGYTLPFPLPSGRESFSPDASYHAGPFPTDGMRFIEGAPTFAVEVRSENDYGRAAERAMAEKRADYLLAGTLVVWDVDPIAETVTKHSAAGVTIFTKSETADAEPALPGWRVAVAELFVSL